MRYSTLAFVLWCVQGTNAGAVRSRSLLVRGGFVVALSAVVNAAIVTAADAAGIAPGLEALTLQSVVVLSAVGAVGAAVVYALLDRYAARPNRTFRRVAAVALVLSFVPDLWLLTADPAATVPGVVVLVVMHVVVAAAAVGFLPTGT